MTFYQFLVKKGIKRKEAKLYWQRITLNLDVPEKINKLFTEWYKTFQ